MPTYERVAGGPIMSRSQRKEIMVDFREDWEGAGQGEPSV